jgi:hypothetical protein
MPWSYISKVLGPGLHWGRSQADYHKAIARAEAEGQFEAAEHIRIILELRNAVMMEKEAPHAAGPNDALVGGDQSC